MHLWYFFAFMSRLECPLTELLLAGVCYQKKWRQVEAVRSQVAQKSSRPKSCRPKLVMSPEILSHVTRNFNECLILKKSNNRKE